MGKLGNPQGKGHLPVLAALSESRRQLAHVPPKHIEQVESELFTSLFVLESDFRFQPVPGRRYWLYEKGSRYRLSLIGPDEWGEALSGRYIGECVLRSDMTWTLSLSEGAAADDDFLAFVEQRRRRFESELEKARSMEELLPHYRKSLPFNQRACAFALAHSLGLSMGKSGTLGLSHSEAKALPKP